MADMEIRAFRREDTTALTRLLHRAYAELAYQGLNYTAAGQDDATTLARATSGRCWVGVTDDTIIGTVTVYYPLDSDHRKWVSRERIHDTAWLSQFAVDPQYRHQGFAGRLWRTGRDWLRSQGVTQVALDTAESAHHLLALYRHWGFRRFGTTQIPGKTYRSVLLAKSLSSC